VARANRPLDRRTDMPKTKLVYCGCTDNCIKLVSTKTRRRHWKIVEKEQAAELDPTTLEQDDNSVDSNYNASRSEQYDDMTEEEGAEREYTVREDAEMESNVRPDDDWDGANQDNDETDILGGEGEDASDRYGSMGIETGMIDAEMVSTQHKRHTKYTE
jgi:hypothetical protein